MIFSVTRVDACYALTMRTIKAHFDGKMIVPDEPVELHADQRLVVTIETAATLPNGLTSDPREWIGIANKYPDDPNYRHRTDDELWKKDHE